MANESASHELRVLVFTSIAKDGEMTCSVLSSAGFRCELLKDMSEIEKRMTEGAGAILISEELLSFGGLQELGKYVNQQPKWSDIPVIIVLHASSNLAQTHQRLENIFLEISNVTLLEKPVRLSTLITVIRSALTARRRQYEIRDLVENLESARHQAEVANRTKSQFLANMSHEIRTPLGAILGFTELMRDPKISDKERIQFADIVARNGVQLSSLINDILDLSKIEAGHLQIESLNISLPSLVAEALSLLRPMAAQKGINLIEKSFRDLPGHVCSDPTRLKQILINIVGNAIKFTDKGWVTVSAREYQSLQDGSSLLGFEVEDSGIGMTIEQQERLFRPFAQADPSTTRKYGGTGLGLILSKRLAQALGGDLILVQSEPGKGSKFLATFQARVSGSTEIEQHSPSSLRPSLVRQKGEKPLGQVRVLLAEDSPDNQVLIRRYLVSEGAEIMTVDNGADAVNEAWARDYDVILMDIQMPVLDGYEATQRLRSNGYKKPIIALTAHALREERERALESGLDDHLTKPINKSALVSAIQKYKSSLDQGKRANLTEQQGS